MKPENSRLEAMIAGFRVSRNIEIAGMGAIFSGTAGCILSQGHRQGLWILGISLLIGIIIIPSALSVRKESEGWKPRQEETKILITYYFGINLTVFLLALLIRPYLG